MTDIEVGKFLSYILRHHPEKIHIDMDKNGYVDVEELIQKVNDTRGYEGQLSIERLHRIVATNDKKRYSFNEDYSRIRAVQGHSFHVDVARKAIPPVVLYHGTSKRAYEKIKKKGLDKMSRDYVHLSVDTETAINVGLRHCKNQSELIVLVIDAKKMLTDGYHFFVAENGVWLTETVPSKYIKTYKN